MKIIDKIWGRTRVMPRVILYKNLCEKPSTLLLGEVWPYKQ